jgi:hypothetical protein
MSEYGSHQRGDHLDPWWAAEQVHRKDAERRERGFERSVPPLNTNWDRDVSAPPPALVLAADPSAPAFNSPDARALAGAYSAAPSRWSARFRDGAPPPPPPPPPITEADIERVMRLLSIDPASPRARALLEAQIEAGALGADTPDLYTYIRAMQRGEEKRRIKRGRLIPQHLLDGHAPPEAVPSLVAGKEGGPVQYDTEAVGRLSAPPPTSPRYGSVPVPAELMRPRATAQDRPLTQSQKRRLRRKRQKLSAQDESFSPDQIEALSRSAMSPGPELSWENHLPNGTVIEPVSPTDPEHPAWTHPTQNHCGAIVWITFQTLSPDPVYFECTLNPYPHPNQPHIVQLSPQQTGGVEVFLGWYNEGE